MFNGDVKLHWKQIEHIFIPIVILVNLTGFIDWTPDNSLVAPRMTHIQHGLSCEIIDYHFLCWSRMLHDDVNLHVIPIHTIKTLI